MLYFVWYWVDLVHKICVLVVQHKAEVTKLWAFRFGICTGRITVDTKAVVPAWPGIRRSLLLWQSAADTALLREQQRGWNVLLLLQVLHSTLGPCWEMQTSVQTGVLKELLLRCYGKWVCFVFLKWKLLLIICQTSHLIQSKCIRWI